MDTGLLKDQLKAWAVSYEKHRDIMRGSITEIKDCTDFDLLIKKKEGDHFFLFCPALSDIDAIACHLKKDLMLSIITINCQSNVSFIATFWNHFIDMPRLKIIFLNPAGATDRQWILCPYTHERICDKKSLKRGLLSLAEQVGLISIDEYALFCSDKKRKGL